MSNVRFQGLPGSPSSRRPVSVQMQRPRKRRNLRTGQVHRASSALLFADDQESGVAEQVLRRRGQILERELSRLQRAPEQVVDAPLQAEKSVNRVGNRPALDAAKRFLPAEDALHRLVRAGILPPDFFVDLEDRSPDEMRAHRHGISPPWPRRKRAWSSTPPRKRSSR